MQSIVLEKKVITLRGETTTNKCSPQTINQILSLMLVGK